MRQTQRKPAWLKRQVMATPEMRAVEDLLADLQLNTVCHEALCPNRAECFSRSTATFMILGRSCTRNCAFCAVGHTRPDAVDAGEPERVAAAVERLGLRYVVVTSVTRDDLADGGAGQFAAVIAAVRARCPEVMIEVLIPDFAGDAAALQTVLDARPDVLDHNVETVPALYGRVRPQADYARSLELLRRAAEYAARAEAAEVAGDAGDAEAADGVGATGSRRIRVKTGFMVGLGERADQVTALMDELRAVGVEMLTVGQYLQPSAEQLDVVEYVTPEQFAAYEQAARERGFGSVAAGPYVRSSYHAADML